MKTLYQQLVLFTENEMGSVSKMDAQKESQFKKKTVSRSNLSRNGYPSKGVKCRNPYGDGFNPNAYHVVAPDMEDNWEIGYCDNFNVDKDYAIPDERLSEGRRTPDCIRGEADLMQKNERIRLVKKSTPTSDSKEENGQVKQKMVRYNRYGRKNGIGNVV